MQKKNYLCVKLNFLNHSLLSFKNVLTIADSVFLPQGEVIKLSDVKDFSLSLWLIFIICVCYYVAVFPFIGLGK